jgi:predicted ester cyclase
MSVQEDNARAMKEWIDRVVNGRELAAADDYVHPEWRSVGQPDLSRGPDGEREEITYLLGAFPDLEYAPVKIIAEDDRVAVYAISRGTHLGDFMGVVPTGKRFEAVSVDINRFQDGKAIEHWGVFDMATVWQQLGVEPPKAE